MRERYDFSNAKQGVHHERYQQRQETRLIAESDQEESLVALATDVKAVFPDSEAVNAVLRSLIRVMKTVKEENETVPKAS